MNYELLGNSDPHLHWHIIPRYKTDPRWGAPIWESDPPAIPTYRQHALAPQAYDDLITQIRSHLR